MRGCGPCASNPWSSLVRKTDPATGRLDRHATPLFLAPVLVFIGSKNVLVGIIGKIPAQIPWT